MLKCSIRYISRAALIFLKHILTLKPFYPSQGQLIHAESKSVIIDILYMVSSKPSIATLQVVCGNNRIINLEFNVNINGNVKSLQRTTNMTNLNKSSNLIC